MSSLVALLLAASLLAASQVEAQEELLPVQVPAEPAPTHPTDLRQPTMHRKTAQGRRSDVCGQRAFARGSRKGTSP